MIKDILEKMWGIIKKNIFVIICIIIFAGLCLVIKYKFSEPIIQLDTSVREFIKNNMRNDSLTSILKVITHLGDTAAAIGIGILVILIASNNIKRIVLGLDLCSIGAFAYILKKVIARPRPVEALVKIPDSFSFPSGHTFFSFGFYSLILYFVLKSKLKKPFKIILTIILSLLIILIPFSRVYLGVHHFTDIVGGLILGLLFLIFYIRTYSYLKEEIK